MTGTTSSGEPRRHPVKAPHLGEPVVRALGIEKYYGRNHVLRGMNMEVRRGEAVMLIGRSGSGKTTFLRCVNFLEEPTIGSIEIDGVRVDADPLHARSREHQEQIRQIRIRSGMVFQEFNLFPHMSVLANLIEAPTRVLHVPRKDAVERAEAYLGKVGLAEKRDEYPARLSGGQKQRVAIARTLLMDPKILILDDSTASVDMQTEYLIQQALSALMRGRTTFVIGQRLRTIMRADEIVVLDDGKVEERGTHAELIKQNGLYRRIYDLELKDQEEALGHSSPIAGESRSESLDAGGGA